MMDSYNELRRVRDSLSQSVGHDVRKLAAMINMRRGEAAARIIKSAIMPVPGDAAKQPKWPVPDDQITPTAR